MSRYQESRAGVLFLCLYKGEMTQGPLQNIEKLSKMDFFVGFLLKTAQKSLKNDVFRLFQQKSG